MTVARIAGVVLAAASTIPSVGTTVTVQDDDLTVEEIRGRKITCVRIRPSRPATDTVSTDGATASGGGSADESRSSPPGTFERS